MSRKMRCRQSHFEDQKILQDALVHAQHEALRILLSSRRCVYQGKAEIAEEISAQFDITLADARAVRKAFDSGPF